MQLMQATLLLLFLATIAVPWARRLALPAEIVLVVGSLALSLIPRLPPLVLDPNIVFILFLPPILFAGGYLTSWRDFKRDWSTVFLLAFGLVLFTMVLVATAVHLLGISWPVAFMLGAIVSPPDASAATAIIKKLGVPRRLMTVIEGESLVNDATALVAYRIALAASATGLFSAGDAAFRFVVVAVGGAVVGLLVAIAGLFIIQRLGNSTAETTLVLITCYAMYLLAERLGFSGVISTVAGGIHFGRKFAALTAAQTHLQARSFWKTFLFIINAFVFTLIGLQMPAVMRSLQDYSWQQLMMYGTTVAFVVIAARFIWMFPAAYLPRKIFPSLARHEPAPRLGSITAISWVGMRGIVSLAAAMSIPLTLPSGVEFPFRQLLIFLTYVVILATLLIPATTLPWLMRRLGIKDDGESRRDERVARRALIRSALKELDSLKSLSSFSPQLLENTIDRFTRQMDTLQDEESRVRSSQSEEVAATYLKQRVLKTQRRELERLRDQATIHDAVFFQLSRELDLEETQIANQRHMMA
jgi:Na+/H+ antiporter